MGGAALKPYGINTRRYQKDEYFRMAQEVSGVLEKQGWNFHVVEAYGQKESFGDMDVVIENSEFPDSYIKNVISAGFGASIIHRNSNTYSFCYKEFQIDFIFHGFEVFYPACDYYRYSPSGNAVGKLFHQFKLSYGHEGLKYIIREEDIGAESAENSHVMKEVILSTDTDVIQSMVGLDFMAFHVGFNTEEDIFKWVTASPYFNPNLFSFEEMNHRARVRDRKRPDYNRLMDWIEAHKATLPNYQRNLNKKDYLPWIVEKFPALQDEFDECRVRYTQNQIVKSKFNGLLVLDWISKVDGELIAKMIHGKTLGNIIRDYKNSIQDFHNFLLTTHEKDVESHFNNWYEEFYKK